MHEISLLENVLEILEENAKSQGFKQVKKVCLEIGMLSCVEQDALRFGFDVVMKNTLAENAELEIKQTQGLGICKHCGQTVQLETLHDPCIICGSPGVVVTQGNEMKIKDLIVI
jgi:hydrogenase nickel incorporation protein HypA/HybF